jgi:AraC family transcriptional regulator
MNKIEPDHYATRRAMLLAGLRQHHIFATAFETIPKQWQQFRALGKINGQIGNVVYGAGCGSTASGFEYLTGVEVDSFSALPEAMGKMRISEQYYAVFLHRDHISTIKKTWELILHDWIPRSGVQVVEKPNFELYEEPFNPETGLGGVEIYIAVER